MRPKKFFDRAKSHDERRALKSVSHQLKSLGIDVGLAMDNESKVVVNLSSRNLSAAETNLLNQGLNHSFFPEKLNISQVRTEFEYIYKPIRHYLNNSNRIVLKQKLMGLYERYVTTFFQQKGRHPSSLSEMQRNALQSLRDDSSIVISKPDKGKGVVIMKSDYHAKMLQILDDKTKFSRIESDNNLSNLSRFQRFLRRPKSKKLLEEDDYRLVYPSATSLPAKYGLPKIHKPTVPL